MSVNSSDSDGTHMYTNKSMLMGLTYAIYLYAHICLCFKSCCIIYPIRNNPDVNLRNVFTLAPLIPIPDLL